MNWLLLVLALIAGAGRALHDVQSHNPDSLAHWGPFWDAETSWKLKYKNADPLQGAKFPGSLTWLVALSDGWHLTNLISWAAADAAVLLVAWAGPYRWWSVGYVVVRRVVFEPLYKYLRRA